MAGTDTDVELLTPPGTGAVAVIVVHGAAEGVLHRLTGRADWPIGCTRLADLAGVDRGLVARLSADVAWLMPHGGTAVTRAVLRAARDAAAAGRATAGLATGPAAGPAPTPAPGPAHRRRWPEAADVLEAAMLELMAAAASPLAFALLAEQPARWRTDGAADDWSPDDAARSRRLDRLLDPPSVVLAGPPNIGKSTLANALAGRAVAITADEPGTTRDAPSVALDLGGLVVRWHDAPGLRATDDALERIAIDRIGELLATADVLVAAADAASDWPPLPRAPDLRIGLRPDLGRRRDADLLVGGRDGTNLAELGAAVRDILVPPADRSHPRPWDARGVLRPLAAAAAAAAATPGSGRWSNGPQNPIDEMPQST